MLTLDLTNEPRWLDLGRRRPGAAAPADHRADGGDAQRPRRRGAARDASDEERALVFAKALARRAVTRLGGRRRRRRQPDRSHTRGASTRCSTSGRSSRRSSRLRREGPAAGSGKKRLRALAEWSFGGGDRYCAACAQAVPGLPGAAEPAADVGGLAGLGPGRPPRRAAARDPRRGDRLGHGRGARAGPGARRRPPDRRRTAARDRGGDGAQAQRTDRRRPWLRKRVSVRLVAEGGRQVRAELEGVGEAGRGASAACPPRWNWPTRGSAALPARPGSRLPP